MNDTLMNQLLTQGKQFATEYGPNVFGALVILIIGQWVARLLSSLVAKALNKQGVEETVVLFTKNILYVALLVCVVIASLHKLGFQTASLLAIVGSAGLAIGLALQGSLSNLASGFLIIILRPFRIGDFVEGAGVSGIIESIDIFTTRLHTPDNKTIFVPNSKMTGDNITNFSLKPTRRVDVPVSVAYSTNLDQVHEVLNHIHTQEERVLKDPAPVIWCTTLADSSVNFQLRVWVKTADYWPVMFSLTEKIKREFDRVGIEIPFPQRQVHVRYVGEKPPQL